MSYSLELYFEPAVPRRRILGYFAARKHFVVANDDVLYENPDTHVFFIFKLRSARGVLLRKSIVSAEFEISFFRPAYFALEAEGEISALVAAFKLRIHDPQMYGMGDGPYSRKGFLDGWYEGTLFAIHTVLSGNPDLAIPSLPHDKLHAAWAWNYQNDEQSKRLKDRRFVPHITFIVIDGRPCSVAVWPLGMPVSLPKVDYVLVGRLVSGEKRYGLAPWSEVLEVARRAGFDTTKDPLDLEYFMTPSQIARWVASIPLIDLDALEHLSAHQIIDAETIETARKYLEAGKPDL